MEKTMSRALLNSSFVLVPIVLLEAFLLNTSIGETVRSFSEPLFHFMAVGGGIVIVGTGLYIANHKKVSNWYWHWKRSRPVRRVRTH